jgi:hypothetical protein
MVKVEIAGEIEIGTETGVEIETEIIAGKIEVHVSLCNAYSVGQNLQLQNIHAHPNGKDQDQEIREIGGDLGPHWIRIVRMTGVEMEEKRETKKRRWRKKKRRKLRNS